jgi:hypothetical protein
MKSQQLALFGPAYWNPEREAHQLLCLGTPLVRNLKWLDGSFAFPRRPYQAESRQRSRFQPTFPGVRRFKR